MLFVSLFPQWQNEVADLVRFNREGVRALNLLLYEEEPRSASDSLDEVKEYKCQYHWMKLTRLTHDSRQNSNYDKHPYIRTKHTCVV